MNKIFLFLFFIALFSCNNKTGKNNIIRSTKDSIEQSSNTKDVVMDSVVGYIDRSLLNGIWAENTEDNALFEIYGDSIRYVEFYNKSYLLILEGKLMNIVLDKGYISKNKILKVDQDSLILRSDYGEIVRLIRRGTVSN